MPNTARAAQAAGDTRLAVLSALGADAHSPVFYNNRAKGDADAVAALGYASVVFMQPASAAQLRRNRLARTRL